MIKKEEVYRIGKLTKPHGVKGEIAFSFTDDVFDRVECDYLVCLIDGILVPFFMEEYRFKSDSTALVKFEDIDTLEQARRLTNVEVYFPLKLAEEATDGELSWNYFVGMQVTDVYKGPLGPVVAVDDTTANTLFVVDYHGEELLIPACEEFIVQIDNKKHRIKMQLPAGLIDIDQVEEI